MKKIYTLFSTFFFLLLAGTTIFTLAVPDKKFSETENKELAQKPTLSTTTIMEGQFQAQLADYLSDQFPLRNFMISLNTATNKLLGNDKIGGAYIGDNGYYFEVVTDNDIALDFFDLRLSNLNSFTNKYPDINVRILFPPTSSDIYSQYLPQNCEIYNADTLYSKVEDSLADYVDIRSALKEKSNEYIYYKTDHHWTSLGAYYAYVEYCKSCNIEFKSYEDFGFIEVTNEFYGSLHSKNLDWCAVPDSIHVAENIRVNNVYVEKINIESGNTIEEKINIYDYSKLNAKDKYLIFFGNNYGKTVIDTECKNGKSLLVVKDSFANSLVPLLTEHYERIVMIDQRYYKQNFSQLIENENITDALFLYEITNLSIQTDLAKINR